MKKILFTYSLIILYTAFFQTDKMKQGISGNIYVKYGNNMPSPGMPANLGRAISCEILVYELTHVEQATSSDNTHFANLKTKLVSKGRSNNDGLYAIELPPGQYSVFVDDKGRLYANSLDGKGNINAITVKKDSVSNRNITISSRATF